jgi:HEAT repeat protein
MRTENLKSYRVVILAVLLLSGTLAAARVIPPEPVGPPPDLTKGGVLINSGSFMLGPTGAHGRMFVRAYMSGDARQILITAVESGSAADGVLAVDDVILGIGDKKFDSDARKSFGRAINDAETEKQKGALKLLRWRAGKEKVVTLKLKVMGTYSDTAPYNCPKSRRIMENALKHLAGREKKARFSLEILAFLASGKPEYIKIAKDRIHAAKWAAPDANIGHSAWNAGYLGIVLCEYYLATGDKYVLPVIRNNAIKTAMGQGGPGTWGHHFVPADANGKLHGRLMGYGGLNCAGVPCFLALTLAKKCGVEHPEVDLAVKRSTDFFTQFVGHGSIGYGYHRASLERRSNGRNALSSNGKNGTAAVVYAVLGNRKVAQWYSKLLTSSYDEREYGHSGNSYGVFWGAVGVNCGGPKAIAAFNKELLWYNALTRKADGSFITQPLGGYYGGRGVLDATVAHVLSNALPLKKIHLTGKGVAKDLHLTDTDVKEAIDAGRWRWAEYNKMTADQLIARLGSWSPAAREWIADWLGKKPGDHTAKLVKMLDSDDYYTRAGACAALGYQGERSAAAVDAVSKALSDKNEVVRVAASYALMRIGPPARRAVPKMYQAALNTREANTMQPTQTAIAYSLGHDPTGGAPLYLTGMFPKWPAGDNPLDGIDRKLFYPAITRVLRHTSARTRGCGAYAFKYLNEQDVGVLAQDIYEVSKNVAPNYPMFGDLPRAHGLDLMLRFRFEEGVTLCIETLEPKAWGGSNRLPHRFATLQKYAGAAKSALPKLKAWRWDFRKPEQRAPLEETIRAIESDTKPMKLTSLVAVVEKRLAAELKSAKTDKQRTALCRKLIKDNPSDYFLQSVALKKLAAMLGEGAFDDVQAAVGCPDPRLAETVRQLGATMPAKWAPMLASARGAKLAGILGVLGQIGDAKTFGAVKKHLKSDDEIVRASAIEAVGAIGGIKAIPMLAKLLVNAESPRERNSAAEAIVDICKTAKNPDKAAAHVVAALNATTEDASRCAVIGLLGRIGGAVALDAIAGTTDDKSRDVKRAAFTALGSSPDPKANDVLMAMVAKIERNRNRGEIVGALVRRVVSGNFSADEKFSRLKELAALDPRGSGARGALEELRWSPTLKSLAMATEWMQNRDPKKYGNISDYAARAAIAIAPGMSVRDPKQQKAAIAAVNMAMTITKDEKTLTAAKAFLAGGDQ